MYWTENGSGTACPPQTGYPPSASSLADPPQPFHGSGSGGGISKPANKLNWQMAERLEMQNQGSGHGIVTEIWYHKQNRKGGFAFAGRSIPEEFDLMNTKKLLSIFSLFEIYALFNFKISAVQHYVCL